MASRQASVMLCVRRSTDSSMFVTVLAPGLDAICAKLYLPLVDCPASVELLCISATMVMTRAHLPRHLPWTDN